MNKKKFEKRLFSIAPICGAVVFSIISVFFVAPAQAEQLDPNSMLAWAKILKNAYKASSADSTATSAQQTMNKDAMTDPLCDELGKARVAAAKDSVKNKLPPDPTTAIANGSCFIDVMDIKIPTTGNSFLDSVTSSLSPFLKSNVCQKTTGWWNDTKNKVLGGDFNNLGSQFTNVLSAVQSSNGSVTFVPTNGLQSFATDAIKAVVANNTQVAAAAVSIPVVTSAATSSIDSLLSGNQTLDNNNNSNGADTQESGLAASVSALRGYLGLR